MASVSEELSKIPKGLSFDEFKYKFMALESVKKDSALLGQIKTYYDVYKDDYKGSGGATKQNIGAVLLGGAVNLANTQEQQGFMSSELIKTNDVLKIAINQQGELNDAYTIGRNIIESGGDQLLLYYQQQTDLLGVVNKGMGMTGTLSKDYRQTLTTANQELLKYGITFGDLSQAAQNLIDTTGRFATLNSETWKQAGVVASAFVGTLSQMVAMYPEFEKVGLGAADTNNAITKAGQSALNVGLQSKKATEDLRVNLGKLNEYGFKNGIEGMSSMVRKATEFRMSMDSVFQVAEKVFDPDQAIELSANLQVLGGAIGDFNDPMKLMYMATNNVEGLQDALIGAASSLTTYNQEQGRFEITGVNLRKAREMAKQLGVDYKELAKGAVAAAERSAASSDLMARGLTLDKDQKEFITNMAQMRGGRMAIEINSDKLKDAFQTSTVYLDQMTDEQAALFKQYQKDFKEATPEQMVRDQATNIENMTRSINYMAAVMREQAGQLGEEVAKTLGINFEKYNEKTRAFADRETPEMKKAIGEYKQTIVDFGKEEENRRKGKVTSPESSKKAEETMKKEKEKENVNDPKNKPVAINENPIIKSQIQVSFPWGFGYPVAEEKGSYLTMG